MKRQLQSGAIPPDPENHAWRKGQGFLSSPSALLHRGSKTSVGRHLVVRPRTS